MDQEIPISPRWISFSVKNTGWPESNGNWLCRRIVLWTQVTCCYLCVYETPSETRDVSQVTRIAFWRGKYFLSIVHFILKNMTKFKKSDTPKNLGHITSCPNWCMKGQLFFSFHPPNLYTSFVWKIWQNLRRLRIHLGTRKGRITSCLHCFLKNKYFFLPPNFFFFFFLTL